MTMTMTSTTEATLGIGRKERRRMVRQWQQEGNGRSLKQWAADNNLVGTTAQAWINAKRGQ